MGVGFDKEAATGVLFAEIVVRRTGFTDGWVRRAGFDEETKIGVSSLVVYTMKTQRNEQEGIVVMSAGVPICVVLFCPFLLWWLSCREVPRAVQLE